MDKENSDYVSIPLNEWVNDNPLFIFTDEQVVEHIYERLSTVYSDITLDYIRRYVEELKDRLGMHYPVDYMEELYTKFETSGDTGYYYYGHCLTGQSTPIFRTVHGEPDVFLVDKKINFIFTYMIDIITIVRHYDTEERVNHAIELAERRFNDRLKSHKLCCDPDCKKGGFISIEDGVDIDSSRFCSLCWVIYTRIDSEFYCKCMNTIQSNKLINFTSSVYESLEIEHKLFTNVLFLCGKNILPESRDTSSDYANYSGINKWISLPLWFHLLLNNNNNNNNNNKKDNIKV